MAGLYIHIPFCKQACHYCDFHFSTLQDLRPKVIDSISKELALQKDYLGSEPIETLYFGGGTPSLLSNDELERILGSVYSNFSLNPEAEITLEANPDDLTREKLGDLKQIGINRLSIGIQSFNENVLSYLNRAHRGDEAIRSVEYARQAGFDNISVDLMYAIPAQHGHDFVNSLDTAIRLSPEHLSVYCLTLEPKTAFGKWQASGKLIAVPEETAAAQFEMLMNRMQSAGYEHYEISNFAKPGLYSRHNTSYWKGLHYLGVGPSAHSYNGTSRQYNISNNPAYLSALSRDSLPFERETLTRENKINEYLFTGLRTMWGCNLGQLLELYHYDLESEHRDYLANLFQRGLAYREGMTLKLTREGKLLADQIASDLFAPVS